MKIPKEFSMDGRARDEVLLTPLECASRIGLTIRALRLYEQQGLISPRRTAKQWRLHGRDEIARLNEILALKSLGLSLREISKLLRGHSTDLEQTLALQREALADTKSRAERGLRVIEALRAKIRNGAVASIDDLMRLAKETKMTDPAKDTVAWRRYEQMRPRTEVAINKALYDDYVGAYEFVNGPLAVVSQRDGQLLYRIIGQSDLEIYPESETEFFMKILPVQLTFIRDEDGAVRSLIHHQNGSESRVVRTDFDYVRASEQELHRRIKEKTPQAESEAALLRVLGELVRRQPNLDRMSEGLSVLVEEQKDFVQAELEKAGALTSLSFKGVSQEGHDIYEAEFERTTMEWGLFLTPRGNIEALYFRSVLV
ncbi:hypothetical protein ASC97_02475 [Rhizobium sp. Root1203]|nr:hypothetical protein ASC97_02475 [Rhizobium sp. Root1203]